MRCQNEKTVARAVALVEERGEEEDTKGEGLLLASPPQSVTLFLHHRLSVRT